MLVKGAPGFRKLKYRKILFAHTVSSLVDALFCTEHDSMIE